MCTQILLEGAKCCPAGGASCLSAELVWRQLMPDFAALAHSLCMALEAWARDAPGTNFGLAPGVEAPLHSPLGLQYTVRPLCPHANLAL